ncbi:hypothetical protein [Methylovulum miyakonense]|uniref:hypothetical protein n=1 Tax=Methylovulum miyakonense TaxID=645578 RepID=UPI001E2C7A0E|nr:hypothetical protein [Methylovulum miyakonense]
MGVISIFYRSRNVSDRFSKPIRLGATINLHNKIVARYGYSVIASSPTNPPTSSPIIGSVAKHVSANFAHDLTEAKNEIKAEMNVRFERIDGELKLNRWMLGVLSAGVISLMLNTFF